jgi:hypothetical protein
MCIRDRFHPFRLVHEYSLTICLLLEIIQFEGGDIGAYGNKYDKSLLAIWYCNKYNYIFATILINYIFS